MAALTVNDIIQVTVGCWSTNQAALNVLHYRVTDVIGAPKLDLIADGLDAIFAPLYKALMSENAKYYGVNTSKIHPLPRSSSVYSAGNQGDGTVMVEPLPLQVCGVISYASELAGRGQRGRSYIGFPPETANDAPTMSPDVAYVTDLDALGEAIILGRTFAGGGNSVTIEFGVWKQSGSTFTSMSYAFGRSKWGTQRRRGNYGQPNPFPPF